MPLLYQRVLFRTPLLLVVIIGLVGVVDYRARAQELSSGVAYRIMLLENNGFDGAVICAKEGGFGVCEVAYDPTIYGIQTDNPPVHFETQADALGVLVLSTGIVRVMASNAAGEIQVGDYITSSDTPGIGMRADQNGFVLGTAIDPLTSEQGLIRVAIKIGPITTLTNTRSNLVTILQNASDASQLQPLDSFRYLIAALMALLSFGMGFIYFGRMSKTGVEAIGRNPLATKAIQFNVLLHVIVALVIVVIGLGVSYMILVI